MLQILDVSRFQPAAFCDYQKVKAAGVAGVVVKATEGVDYVDPCFYEHAKKIRLAGLELNAYHYLRVRARKAQDAELQAEQFCEAYLKACCTGVPWLDCELEFNQQAVESEWLQAIRQFVDVTEFWLGCKPDIYTFPGFWMSRKALCEAQDLLDCRLVIAHYTPDSKPGLPRSNPKMPGPWGEQNWFGWQYAASAGVLGRCDGIPGLVDRSMVKADKPEDLRRPACK